MAVQRPALGGGVLPPVIVQYCYIYIYIYIQIIMHLCVHKRSIKRTEDKINVQFSQKNSVPPPIMKLALIT